MASIHLGSRSVVGASVHEFRKWVEGEREGGKAPEVVQFQMSGQHLLVYLRVCGHDFLAANQEY